ncbi:RNA-binding cell elongation regulator Jag/EloR [Carnobacterium mobile]|uniref:RNA-binding cell elongation regulator Jag/EloR n=1 Tax=Carnobacterium mobile TaxID=2750 RepID=UPI00055276DA|nr:RNA-binding cell elongation regulator Jag/EloR [Carnobacterium mobile]
MNKYTAQAATTAEAIQKGLKILGISEKEASIEVITEGKKGVFGFGQKDAIVIVEKKKIEAPLTRSDAKIDSAAILENLEGPEAQKQVKAEFQEEKEASHQVDQEVTDTTKNVQNDEEAVQLVSAYLIDIAQKMGAPATVSADIDASQRQVVFHIHTEKAGLIIGKHGKVLNALQSLAQVVLYHHAKTKFTVIVNVGDYRERREATLKHLAERTAEKVMTTNQPVFLEPMPAFERKQIHFYLSKNKQVTTHSEGNEPHRYLVVEPTK